MNKNIIGKVNAKHGIFHFCHFDEFIGKSFREYGEYSELELKTILEFINEGDVIFDIGANIGCFSVPFAKKVGSNGKVYAFEPQKFIFNLLKENAVCNELNNLQIFNNAIGDANTILELNDFDYSQSGNFGGITLTENYDNSVCAKIKGTKKNNLIKETKYFFFLSAEIQAFPVLRLMALSPDVPPITTKTFLNLRCKTALKLSKMTGSYAF